jgi:MYXO-CTERM domain-containing protein
MDRRALLIATLVLGNAPSARADAIGPCGARERVVMNPTSPGAMHHGGFHCEPDPGAPPPPPSAPPSTPSEVQAAVSAAELASLEAAAASARAEADMTRMRVEAARANGTAPTEIAPLEAAAAEASARADAADARLEAARTTPPPPPTSAPPPAAAPPATSSSSSSCRVSHDAPSAWMLGTVGLAALALSRRRAHRISEWARARPR